MSFSHIHFGITGLGLSVILRSLSGIENQKLFICEIGSPNTEKNKLIATHLKKNRAFSLRSSYEDSPDFYSFDEFIESKNFERLKEIFLEAENLSISSELRDYDFQFIISNLSEKRNLNGKSPIIYYLINQVDWDFNANLITLNFLGGLQQCRCWLQIDKIFYNIFLKENNEVTIVSEIYEFVKLVEYENLHHSCRNLFAQRNNEFGIVRPWGDKSFVLTHIYIRIIHEIIAVFAHIYHFRDINLFMLTSIGKKYYYHLLQSFEVVFDIKSEMQLSYLTGFQIRLQNNVSKTYVLLPWLRTNDIDELDGYILFMRNRLNFTNPLKYQTSKVNILSFFFEVLSSPNLR